MQRFRRAIAACGLLMLLFGAAAPAAMAGGKCSPGQHGNPHPGFKPGSCKN